MRRFRRALTQVETLTFTRFLHASFFNGLVNGVLQLVNIIAKKTLLASDLQITFFTMVWPVSNFLSLFWGEVMAGRDKKKYLYLAGVAGRLSLVLAFLVTNAWHLLMLLFLVYSFNALIFPAQNSILQSNMRLRKTGQAFGWAASISAMTALLAAYLSGRVLDVNGEYFRAILAFAGLLGFLHCYFLARIKQDRFIQPAQESPVALQTLYQPFIRSYHLMKEDRRFARFETFFFLYGCAFMVVLPAIPKLLVVELNLSYTIISLARIGMAQIGLILLSPMLGLVFDKMTPQRFTGLSFIILSLYSLLLGLVLFLPPVLQLPCVLLAFFIFSLGMTGVNVSWNVSSIHFAGERDASTYQGVHITLTAIRGCVAPLLGYLIMETISLVGNFFFSFFLLLIAAWGMFRLKND